MDSQKGKSIRTKMQKKYSIVIRDNEKGEQFNNACAQKQIVTLA